MSDHQESKRGVLFNQHSWLTPPGFIAEILQEHQIIYDVLSIAKNPLPDLTPYDAVIALGGPQHVYEEDKYLYFVQEKTLLSRVIEPDIPFLGMCLGGQLLASALGGTVRRHVTTEFGFACGQLTQAGRRDPLFRGVARRSTRLPMA